MPDDGAVYEKVVFVGGYPRSGTTVTHALLCTSEKTVPYHPEVSYLKFIFQSYHAGINNWDSHTKHLFKDHATYKKHFLDIINVSFSYLRMKLGDHKTLCIKDPLLTPYFHWVYHLLGDRASFVTVIRHPFDTIRSNIEVLERMGQPQSEPEVRSLGIKYVNFYKHLDNPFIENNLCVFRYEDIQESSTVSKLRAFTGLDDISPENVWKDEKPLKESPNPWFSPKYNSPIDTTRRLDPLNEAFQPAIREICGNLMHRFDYN